MSITFSLVFIQIIAIILGESTNFIISSKSNLKIYWNIPTFQCRPFNLNFTELSKKYGIIQNENDNFLGNSISIMYDPGDFPAFLIENGSSIERNGGIPQNGNIEEHLKLFEESVEKNFDAQFDGLGIIDFESWRPIFRQNFAPTLSIYKNKSIERELKLHPYWPKNLIQKEAKRKFEFYGRMFMEETLNLAQKLRPNAKWGYYAYPYCFNKSPSNMKEDCPEEVQEENNRLYWLFSESNLFLPSIYFNEKLSSIDKMELIKGRINEAQRIIGDVLKNERRIPSIFPYFWYKYQDSKKFLNKDDLRNSFSILSNSGIDGFVIWGSSSDVNSKSNCLKMYNYLDNVLGPILINSI